MYSHVQIAFVAGVGHRNDAVPSVPCDASPGSSPSAESDIKVKILTGSWCSPYAAWTMVQTHCRNATLPAAKAASHSRPLRVQRLPSRPASYLFLFRLLGLLVSIPAEDAEYGTSFVGLLFILAVGLVSVHVGREVPGRRSPVRGRLLGELLGDHGHHHLAVGFPVGCGAHNELVALAPRPGHVRDKVVDVSPLSQLCLHFGEVMGRDSQARDRGRARA